jgi:hypothetical protein
MLVDTLTNGPGRPWPSLAADEYITKRMCPSELAQATLTTLGCI